ncbi:hypothetical protein HK100_002184 [Physocladia obscura]|uniref:Transmembrane protein n=1 Tax=Physocladia obscura TaxID=109957 RepID=A0AAD5TA50_9FUNG|nr:hypothetical protein HK100_002184 [Physocladia obscura]
MALSVFETAAETTPITPNGPLITTEAVLSAMEIVKSAVTANSNNNENMLSLSQATLTNTQTATASTLMTAVSATTTSWPIPAGWPPGFTWPLPNLPPTFNGTFSVTSPVPRNWPAGYPWPLNTDLWPLGTTQLISLSTSVGFIQTSAVVTTDGGTSYSSGLEASFVTPVVGVGIGVLGALVVACVTITVCYRQRMRVVRMRKGGNSNDREALSREEERERVGITRSASLLPIVSRNLRRAATVGVSSVGGAAALRLPTTDFVIASLLETTNATSNNIGEEGGLGGSVIDDRRGANDASANKNRSTAVRSISPVPPLPPLPHWVTLKNKMPNPPLDWPPGFPFPPLDYALPSNFDGSFTVGSHVPRDWPVGYSWPPGSGLYPPGTSQFVPSSSATQTQPQQTNTNTTTIQQEQTPANNAAQLQMNNLILVITVGILAALLATAVAILIYRRQKIKQWKNKTGTALFDSDSHASPRALYSNDYGSIYSNNNNLRALFSRGSGGHAISTRTGATSIKAPSVSQRSFFMNDTIPQSSGDVDNEDGLLSPELMIAALLANSTADSFVRPKMNNGAAGGAMMNMDSITFTAGAIASASGSAPAGE